ncbi:hypothetical protein CC80DRAFT_497424 [Byssothecium circinans]|uniref:Uncharacterized protein n=1 Tax=Byssothecium circinans TaxID=147558 RepID=A0A6A5TKP1_9PLEO|nr:hypothetical protein CC80DRAFT_497424 [Byssothecium circinans]
MFNHTRRSYPIHRRQVFQVGELNLWPNLATRDKSSPQRFARRSRSTGSSWGWGNW